MYGRRCVAIVTDAPAAIVGWAITVAAVDADMAAEDAQQFIPTRQDNMGRDSGVYY